MKTKIIGLHPKASIAVFILACGLLIAFFMPWVHLGFFTVSGYQLGRLGSGGNYVWIIPILALATIGSSFVTNNRPIGIVSGLVPILALLYGAAKLLGDHPPGAPDEFFKAVPHLLGIGVYLGIICSIGLIAFGLATKPSPLPTADKYSTRR